MVIRCNQHNVQGKKVNSLIVRNLVDMFLHRTGFVRFEHNTEHNCQERLGYRRSDLSMVDRCLDCKLFGLSNQIWQHSSPARMQSDLENRNLVHRIRVKHLCNQTDLLMYCLDCKFLLHKLSD